MFPMFWDPYYFLAIIGFVIVMLAQVKVSAAFSKYSQIPASSGYSGAEVARLLLDRNNIHNVRVEITNGFLGDHYDPLRRVIRLSPSVYQGTSIASVSVAAHETGHALQHARGYVPLQLRSALFPIASLGSSLGFFIAIMGLFIFGSGLLFQIGFWLFGGAVLFQIVTLPVEFNASLRALHMVENSGILARQEMPGARKVLQAAALTYVAAAAAAILNLLRLFLLGRRND